MNIQEITQKYDLLEKKKIIPIGIVLLGLIFFIYGLIGLFASPTGSQDISFEKAQTQESQVKQEASIAIDVEGAVVHPGVYHFPSDARIQDVLIRSGGLSENADRTWVAKNLNLATKIIDGGKIYIPFNGESQTIGSTTGSKENKGSVGSLIGDGLININTASEKELGSLPGVGTVTVSKIIFNRPYQSLDELVSKKVVSKKVFDGIKDKVAL